MENNSRVAIVVDSAASLPADLPQGQQIYTVPMSLTFDSRSYVDGRDLTPDEFYQLLRESPTLPTTSAPSPAMFLDVFREAAEDSHAILCLVVASRFSSALDSARTAAQEAVSELPEVEIHVVDSKSAAGGEGLVALEAWRAAQNGETLEAVTARANSVVARVRLLAFLDTLYYVWKGGRVPRIAHAGTSLLRIKPLFELVQGDVHNIARPRTRQRAMRRIIQLMHERIEPGRVHAAVLHADAADSAEELRRAVESEFDCDELFVSEFTPVMGAHTGPGLLGIAFWCDTQDSE